MSGAKVTPKERVLEKWNAAYCSWSSLYGEWRVYRSYGGHLIGVGETAVKAWRSAAESLKGRG